jgi:carbamoyltransferase
VGLESVDHIAINRDPKANLIRKGLFTLAKRPSPRLILARISNARAWLGIEDAVRREFPAQTFNGKVHHVEHHLAHMASAFLVSPYEEAVAVSVDGFGDFASTAWGYGRGQKVSLDGRVYFPHSLGAFYQSLTHFLGFPHYGDEYKVMGLAPYGEPTYADALRQVVLLQPDGTFRLNLEFFRHVREGFSYEWLNATPAPGAMYNERLSELLGPPRSSEEELTQRHKDIARSAQLVYEEAFFHLLEALYNRYASDTIVLAGGCAQNSVANGKIYERSRFKQAYIPPSAPDAGGAIGAAALIWHQLNDGAERSITDSPFVGPAFDDAYVNELLSRNRSDLDSSGCAIEPLGTSQAMCHRVARAIADGNVVGWFQGRMEWGPRALGNRSIICDPRRPDMKQLLNQKIKRRESFRPFAPSVLREAVTEWFETDDDVPFMSKVFTIREGMRSAVPAVTHVDGTGRLQTVDEADNERYYHLIAAFRDLTDVPMVLNTSFNENEPIVCKPEEALNCFLRSDMDMLVLNDLLIERKR